MSVPLESGVTMSIDIPEPFLLRSASSATYTTMGEASFAKHCRQPRSGVFVCTEPKEFNTQKNDALVYGHPDPRRCTTIFCIFFSFSKSVQINLLSCFTTAFIFSPGASMPCSTCRKMMRGHSALLSLLRRPCRARPSSGATSTSSVAAARSPWTASIRRTCQKKEDLSQYSPRYVFICFAGLSVLSIFLPACARRSGVPNIC